MHVCSISLKPLCLRDQVELADGDALVPVAHFSKEVSHLV